MSHIDDSTGQKTLIGKGYAGHGTGLNNPEMQAEAFYGAGEYIDSLGGPGVAPLGARAGVHAVAGATAGGLNAAIGGGDIGLGTLVGGMSGGSGTWSRSLASFKIFFSLKTNMVQISSFLVGMGNV